MRQAYARLPHLKITELLLEIDHWTGFSPHFTLLKSQEPATDKVLLLTCHPRRCDQSWSYKNGGGVPRFYRRSAFMAVGVAYPG
jgi:hypothetical protein